MSAPFLNKSQKAKAKSRSRFASKSNNSKRRVRAETSSSPDTPKNQSNLLPKFSTLIFLLLISAGIITYIKRDQWGISTLVQQFLNKQSESPSDPKPKPDPATYAKLTAQLASDKSQLKHRYLSAATRAEQEQIIDQATNLLEDILPKMMRCWLGHPWDFNGTATVPGEGKIACGYFVSVIMRDAGFQINRIKVAQQPSQNIIRTFVSDRSAYEIKTNTPYQDYLADITKKYQGIHIVGLDNHVAFIVIKDNEMRFIHSGGLQLCVVDEDKHDAYALEHSNYRVISNISRNRNVIKKWILNQPFPTVGTQTANR